jgi:hypothetical protein
MAEELRQVASDNGLLSSPIALASWVTEVLGPTLRARRIAAMRGAATEQEIHARNWATMPPPAVEGGDGTPSKWRSASTEAVSRFPGGDTSARTSSRDAMPVAPRDEAPSAVETTGPLEPPVSSRSFDDRTQILGPDAGRGRSRGERIALYVVVLAALLGVVWMVASPDSVAPFFRMSPDAAGANADPGVPREDGAPDPPPASAKQGPAGEKPGAPAGDEGEEKLVPEIQPSGMR